MSAVSASGQSAVQSKLPAHESIISKELHELRERWHRTPFLRRINALSIFFFCLIAAGYAILLADDAQHFRDQDTRSKAYPNVLHGISTIASSISGEIEATVAYQKSQTTASWNALGAVRAVTTASLNAQRGLFSTYSDAVIDPLHALQQGTRLSEVGIGSVFNMRSQVVQGQVVLPPQGIRNSMYSVNARVLQQYAKTASTYAFLSPMSAALQAYATGAIGWHTGRAMAAVATFNAVGLSSNTSGIASALKSAVVNMQYVTMLETYAVTPLIATPDRKHLNAAEGAAGLHNRLQSLLTLSTFGTWYNITFTPNTSASFPAARAALASLNDQVLAASSTSLDTAYHYQRSLAMLIIALVVVLASSVQWGVVEFVNAERNAIRIHNAHVMHDVLVRVGELVGHMANFSLDPLPPPRSMMGTHVGVLELRLQHCLASLKTLAPALPPLLFPQRLSALAAEYSEVHDPAAMQFNRKLRDSLLKETLHQVTVDDLTHRNPFVGSMQGLTELQQHECEAAFVYVDLSSFFDMSSVEKMQLSQECFRETASLVEECVYQFKGVLHTVSLDRAVGVWNIASPVPNACEQAATCALVLSHRLAVLRRQNRLLSQYFQINIGVVAGLVQYGVFGDGHHKYVGIFGPPISRGIKVARANAAHMTTVAMDEAVRRAVNKIYLAKPIELLEDGACVYEVIHEGSRREADLETQLLVYSKAFELYQKKYYREALRAFRGYTKLYGYDSSVERIQTLITGV